MNYRLSGYDDAAISHLGRNHPERIIPSDIKSLIEDGIVVIHHGKPIVSARALKYVADEFRDRFVEEKKNPKGKKVEKIPRGRPGGF